MKFRRCPSLLSVAVIKHYDKRQLGGGKGLFYLQVIVHEGKSKQEFKAETQRQELGLIYSRGI